MKTKTIMTWLLTLNLFLVIGVAASRGQAEELSPSAKILKERVTQGDYEAITLAADSQDVTVMPYLKFLAADKTARSNQNSAAFLAHAALARLGNAEALDQIIEEVDSDDFNVQDSAIIKLTLVGGKPAMRKLFSLLDDVKPRVGRNNDNMDKTDCGFCGDAPFMSRAATVVVYLARVVENPPTGIKIYGGKRDIELWKEWFQKNGYLVE